MSGKPGGPGRYSGLAERRVYRRILLVNRSQQRAVTSPARQDARSGSRNLAGLFILFVISALFGGSVGFDRSRELSNKGIPGVDSLPLFGPRATETANYERALEQ